MCKILFIKNINKYDISKIVMDIEEELCELNNHDYDFSFGGDKDIIESINRILQDIDFHNIDLCYDFGCYWCTCLTEEPFYKIQHKYTEEDFFNLVKEYHLSVNYDDNKNLVLYFKNNSKSPLYKFFYNHKDGYGGNMAYSINAGLNKLWKYIKKELREHADSYGNFYTRRVL